MKRKTRLKNLIKSLLLDNKGTTMMETVVSFVVLVIILAVIYQMISYCSQLRMRATDEDNMIQAINKAMYKDTIDSGNDKVQCIQYSTKPDVLSGADITEGPLFYMVVDYEETDPSNNYPAQSLDYRIWINNIDASCYKAIDMNAQNGSSADMVVPTVISFKYNSH